MDLTFPWLEFHGIDVAEVFYLLIDVAVAVLATRTSISGNPATPTSISRKASHGNVNLGGSGHANVDFEERRHANVNPEERNTRAPATPVVRECQKRDLRPQVLD